MQYKNYTIATGENFFFFKVSNIWRIELCPGHGPTLCRGADWTARWNTEIHGHGLATPGSIATIEAPSCDYVSSKDRTAKSCARCEGRRELSEAARGVLRGAYCEGRTARGVLRGAYCDRGVLRGATRGAYCEGRTARGGVLRGAYCEGRTARGVLRGAYDTQGGEKHFSRAPRGSITSHVI